ncbi:unnamed protein product [Effrenium voratum]|uniref:Uncharacterized protein n=1 Tax=Effrenium voratum TaxID=2562239 RepID=A0AA36IG66_9DINO|nr:unnamed protein product [Effrenium voratum]
MAAPDPSTSDFVKVGFDKVNFFVMFPTFTAAFTIPGILGGVAAFYHKSSAVQKVELVADYSLGPLYVAMFLVRIIFSFIQSNLADARRNTGINVPDQHAYKVVTGSAAGSLVLMDDEGAFGRFNRAQRGVQNVWENVFPLSIEVVLTGLVFPWTVAGLLCLFALLRAKASISYAEKGRMARISGNMASNICGASIAGLTLAIGVYATHLELAK